MSAYSLQQQLAAARATYQAMAGQVAAASIDRVPAPAIDKVSADASQVQGEISHALTEAYNLQTAIDAYQGLPTAAQLRDLDWVWQDAIAGVTALNRLILQDLPALGLSGPPPAPVPVRP
jgi:hypothetical protein